MWAVNVRAGRKCNSLTLKYYDAYSLSPPAPPTPRKANKQQAVVTLLARLFKSGTQDFYHAAEPQSTQLAWRNTNIHPAPIASNICKYWVHTERPKGQYCKTACHNMKQSAR